MPLAFPALYLQLTRPVGLFVLIYSDASWPQLMSVKNLLHDCTLATGSGLTRVLGPLHLGNHELKRLLYILVVARAGFSPRAFELCGKGTTVFGGDLALFGAEVGFVAYDDERNPVDGL
jgi:hypothetical protein